jgi:hypothetical protein
MAATLRQTAAPAAKVNSDTHMAILPLSVSLRLTSVERAINAEPGDPFRELFIIIWSDR